MAARNGKATPEIPVNGADLARLLRVDTACPTKWAKRGCPQTTDGRYRLSEVVKWLIARERRRATAASGRDPDLRRWRRAKARQAELSLGVQEASLIDINAAVNHFRKFQADAKSILESLPEGVALLVGDAETREVVLSESRRIVQDGIRLVGAAEEAFYSNLSHETGGDGEDDDAGV